MEKEGEEKDPRVTRKKDRKKKETIQQDIERTQYTNRRKEYETTL
jgi:hypothetical protein